MADDELADDDELVIAPGSFTGPERREVQHRFKVPFGDLMTYTFEAVLNAGGDQAPRVLTGADGTLVYPDEVMQFMVWVQARRTKPDAQLEDFDELTLVDLLNARSRGARRGKALTGGSSTTSPTGSPSADSSPA